MAGNKTVETEADVASFIGGIEDAAKRADAETLAALMARVSGEPAKLWGPSIIGFGSYHYRYESGREGDSPIAAFLPRKAEIVLYNMRTVADGGLLERLGKHKTGKGCLYIKRLADVDLAVLEQAIAASIAHMRATHG